MTEGMTDFVLFTLFLQALLDNFTVLWFVVAETDVWSVYER